MAIRPPAILPGGSSVHPRAGATFEPHFRDFILYVSEANEIIGFMLGPSVADMCIQGVEYPSMKESTLKDRRIPSTI